MTAEDMRYAESLHSNGVHTHCQRANGRAENNPRRCAHAGKVERFHSHDFDGPLVCGCDDFGV